MIVCSFDIDSTQYDYTDPQQDAYARQLKDTLEAMRRQRALFLIHNTGRPFPWVCHGDINTRYLNPVIAEADAIISHSGTEIYFPGTPAISEAWQKKILQVTSQEAISELRNLLSRDFSLHPESFDSRFKTSVIVPPEDHTDACMRTQALLDRELPGQFDLVFWNNKSIDFTPCGINKRTALEHVVSANALKDFPLYVAGDSANDVPMFEVPHARKIVVGNATEALRQHTKGMSDVYTAPKTEPAARGVLAGLRHYGVIAPAQTAAPLNTPSTPKP